MQEEAARWERRAMARGWSVAVSAALVSFATRSRSSVLVTIVAKKSNARSE